MNLENINSKNKNKKFYIIICSSIFLILYSWILKDYSATVLFRKFIVYLFFCTVLYFGLIKEKDLFSPFSLFSIFYFSLFIYNSEISYYFLPIISDRSFILIISGSFSFVLGMIAFKILRNKLRSNRFINDSNSGIKPITPTYSYWFLLFFGLTPTIISIITKGLPILMVDGLSGNEIQDIRVGFPIPIISMFSCLTNVALLSVMKTRKTIPIIIVLIIVLLSSSIIFAKLDLVITLFFAAYGCIKFKLISNKSSKWILCFVAVTIFFCLSQSYRYARGGQAGKLYSFEKKYIEYGSTYYSEYIRDFYLTYMYMVTPFSNLDYILENYKDFKNGRMTFWSLISISQIKRIYNIKPILKPIRVNPFNTHTFLADFYIDFGVLGILVLPFLLGIVVYFFYSRILTSEDPLTASVYLYWGLATLMMFFSNHFTSVGYPIHYLIIIGAYKKSTSLLRSIKNRIFISQFALLC